MRRAGCAILSLLDIAARFVGGLTKDGLDRAADSAVLTAVPSRQIRAGSGSATERSGCARGGAAASAPALGASPAVSRSRAPGEPRRSAHLMRK